MVHRHTNTCRGSSAVRFRPFFEIIWVPNEWLVSRIGGAFDFVREHVIELAWLSKPLSTNLSHFDDWVILTSEDGPGKRMSGRQLDRGPRLVSTDANKETAPARGGGRAAEAVFVLLCSTRGIARPQPDKNGSFGSMMMFCF
jgi:hypothetical protein